MTEAEREEYAIVVPRIRNRIRETLVLLCAPSGLGPRQTVNWWFDWVYADTDQEQDFSASQWAALMAVDRQMNVLCEGPEEVPYADARWLAVKPLAEAARALLGPIEEEPTHFPLDRWGTVTGEVFQRICIVRSDATSFLVLTEENGKGFDNWLETAEDVGRYLGELQVVWDRPMPHRLVERAVNTLLKRAELVGFLADPELLACVALEHHLNETPLGVYECKGVVQGVFAHQGMLVPSRGLIAWEMLGLPEDVIEGSTTLFFADVGLRLSMEEADRKRLAPFFCHLNRWWKAGRDW